MISRIFSIEYFSFGWPRFSIGDADTNFTIQSTSQVVTYAICLTELGEERVHKFQGREPSGRMFNEIALDHQSK